MFLMYYLYIWILYFSLTAFSYFKSFFVQYGRTFVHTFAVTRYKFTELHKQKIKKEPNDAWAAVVVMLRYNLSPI